MKRIPTKCRVDFIKDKNRDGQKYYVSYYIDYDYKDGINGLILDIQNFLNEFKNHPVGYTSFIFSQNFSCYIDSIVGNNDCSSDVKVIEVNYIRKTLCGYHALSSIVFYERNVMTEIKPSYVYSFWN